MKESEFSIVIQMVLISVKLMGPTWEKSKGLLGNEEFVVLVDIYSYSVTKKSADAPAQLI